MNKLIKNRNVLLVATLLLSILNIQAQTKEGIWKNTEGNTYIHIKGKKAIEYKIQQNRYFVRSKYKVRENQGTHLVLVLRASKSTIFPITPGTPYQFEWTFVHTDSPVLCSVVTETDQMKGIQQTCFTQISKEELDNFIQQFIHGYDGALTANWVVPHRQNQTASSNLTADR